MTKAYVMNPTDRQCVGQLSGPTLEISLALHTNFQKCEEAKNTYFQTCEEAKHKYFEACKGAKSELYSSLKEIFKKIKPA